MHRIIFDDNKSMFLQISNELTVNDALNHYVNKEMIFFFTMMF